jgi:hypothetical protein
MFKIYRSAAFMTGLAALAGCGSTTPADSARMSAYRTEHAPGARGAPTPRDLAAMGLFKSTEQLRREGNEFVSPAAAPPTPSGPSR